MAQRADLIIIKVQRHSSGTATEIIAESTSISLDLSAEPLETTSQTSALNASFISGKVSGTVSGDYLLATDSAQFTELFTAMNAGDSIYVEVQNNGTAFIDCEGVVTSLNIGGGLSDSLATGSYTIQLSGNPAV